MDEPRMIPETGQHLRVRLYQGSNLWPILLTAAINYHPRKLLALAQKLDLLAGETFGLQVVVGVEQHLICRTRLRAT